MRCPNCAYTILHAPPTTICPRCATVLPNRSSRRQFLVQSSLAGASVFGLGTLLSACSETTISFSPTPTNTPNGFHSQWELASSWGIKADSTGQHWYAGHVNAIEELDAHTLIVAADSSGVWFVTDSGVGMPLSLRWESVDMRTLAQGPLSSHHYYAGGISGSDGTQGALYMSNPTSDLGVLADWIAIPLSGVGAIQKALVVNVGITAPHHYLVLATSNGVWWSIIPSSIDGTGYHFQLAIATGSFNPADSFYSLAVAANATIVASTAGTGHIGYGNWSSGNLTFSASTLTVAFATSSLQTISLTSSAMHPLIMYAVGSGFVDGIQDTISAVLQSIDGGHTFSPCQATLITSPPATLQPFAGTQGGYNNVICVSPTHPEILAIGWVNGPFLSLNSGATFSPPSGDFVAGHQDFHAITFSTAVPGRIYCGSDGGVVAWENLANASANPDNSINFTGVTLSSLYNRHLANLQFQGPAGREFQGSISASYQAPGLVGGGLQDNNVVYATITGDLGTTSPWRSLIAGASDGENCLFLYFGGMLYRGNGSDATSVEVSGTQPGSQRLVPVRRQKPQMNLPSINGTIDIVNSPLYRNDEGELLYAIGTQSGTADIYGLFAQSDGSDTHWNYLATMPSPSEICALNSGSGTRIFAGTVAGQIFRFDPAHPSTTTPSIGLPTDARVIRIIVHTDSPNIDAFALVDGASTVFHTTDGTTWSALAGNGLPSTKLYDFVSDWTTTVPVLIIASDDGVFASRDNGTHWEDITNGLPRRAHCNALHFVTQAGVRYLYLGTFGWSMWRTRIE